MEYAYEQMRKGENVFSRTVVVWPMPNPRIPSSFNCSVALYHCYLMAHTLGLGCCFNGFLVNAVNHDRRIKNGLGIPPEHQCYGSSRQAVSLKG